MRIEGQDPVVLDGYLDVQDDSGNWSVHTEAHMNDTDAMRIAAPGRVGFSTDTPDPSYVYDDFAYTLLEP